MEIITRDGAEYIVSNGVEYQISGYKPVVIDIRSGQPKYQKGICDKCGNAFGDLKLRNGAYFCNKCRIDDRTEAFITDHANILNKEITKKIATGLIEDVDSLLDSLALKYIKTNGKEAFEKLTDFINDIIKKINSIKP